MDFTNEQKEAIFSPAKKIIVSASAGSGKTMVMIKRVLEKVIKERVPLENILVVTFTKAAASEMKSKLVDALEEIDDKDEFIKNQIRDIASCNICTLDSFCAKLLKSYFYEIGLDPAFIVIDQKEEESLINKAFQKLFEEKFEDMDQDFFEISDMFSTNRNLDGLKEVILKIYRFFIVQPYPDEYFKERLDKTYSTDLEHNVAILEVNKFIYEKIKPFKDICKKLIFLNGEYNNAKLGEILSIIDANLFRFEEKNTLQQNLRAINLLEKVDIVKPTLKGDEEIFAGQVADFKNDYNKLVMDFEKCFDGDIEDVKNSLTFCKHKSIKIYELVKRFEEIYLELKKDKGALDFSDLERNTFELLKKETVIESIKERIKYVFVDEYQDINRLQEEILSRLEINGNVFLVGDVKQSIYAFRHCEPQIFLDNQNRFSELQDGKVVLLNHNFRSHKDILNFTNEIFMRTMKEDFSGVNYLRDAMLQKGANEILNAENELGVTVVEIERDKKEKEQDDFKYYSVKDSAESANYESSSGVLEGQLIASEIKKLLGKFIYLPKSKTIKERRVKFSDIVILVNSRDTATFNLLAELKKAGIPYATDVDEEIFDDEVMNTLLNILKIVDNSKLDLELISVLTSKCFKFSFNDLANIKTHTTAHSYFYNSIEDYVQSEKCSGSLQDRLKAFYAKIERYKFLAGFMTVSSLICEIVKDFDFELISLESQDGEKRLIKLQKLLESLSQKSYNDNLSKYITNFADTKSTFQNTGEENAVKITTIHKSKGLEYPIVMMPFVSKRFNETDFKNDILLDKKYGILINNFDFANRSKFLSIFMLAGRINSKEELIKEKLRLFYVALTRPINYLYLYKIKDENNGKIKELKDCNSFGDFLDIFLNDENIKSHKNNFKKLIIRESDNLNIKSESEKREVYFTDNFAKFNETKKLLNNIFNFNYLHTDAVNIPQKISVTELLNIDDENIYALFKFDNEGDNSPINTIEYANPTDIGNAYHKLLSLIDFEKIDFNSVYLLDELNKQLEIILIEGKISKEELNLVDLNKIKQLFINDEFKNIMINRSCIFKEQSFFCKFKASDILNVNVDDIVEVFGICDLIVLKDNKLFVIDYKTSKIKNIDRLKEKYKKQLEIYKVAVSENFNNKNVEGLIYSFELNKFIKL